MKHRRILLSPLNWGFGHAGRMIPLARGLRERGHEVIFAIDPDLKAMVENELTDISIIDFPGIKMHYSRFLPQYLNILIRLPHIFAASIREHKGVKKLVAQYKPDMIISDNRFGFYHKNVFSVYVTHMLRIPFPAPFSFLEFIGIWLHRRVIRNFDLCLVPDFPNHPYISGSLSHLTKLPEKVIYCGPLSRFSHTDPVMDHETNISPYLCLIVSGPEPQSTIFMNKIISATSGWNLVILSGKKPSLSEVPDKRIQFVTNPDTLTMKKYILNSRMVISRSGYTTIMELISLKKRAVIVPTPGQTEQEYLARYLNNKNGFISVKQIDTDIINRIIDEYSEMNGTVYPDNYLFFEKALDILSEEENQ